VLRPRLIAVAVPAHNEQALLPGCLESLRRAAAQPDLPPVRVVVVADRCTDDTVRIARAAGADVFDVDLRSAGAARRFGLDEAVATASVPADQLWLATTDADSRVPREWFLDQLRWRAEGWDAVAGTVAVADWSGHDRSVADRFADRYAWSGSEHPHVHGANLSLTGSAYAAIGGFPPLALAEDHALVAALESRGLRVARAGQRPVVTSSRRDPRATGGFGTLLTTLADG
jgi:glycosyltransferase involved in cell wall biosynthesis